MQQIAASEFLQRFSASDFGSACLDVRSEGEFETGALPSFVNVPILTNSERHEVGLCYKTRGREEAVRLGHELVDPIRLERVEQWTKRIDAARARHGFVTCWRGGLRSGISSQWIREAGRDVTQILGGYKAIRHELIAPFLDESAQSPVFSPIQSMVRVISGYTGSGKTKLFQSLSNEGVAWVDLEAHACHRGSSFGKPDDGHAPAQATFENGVGWDLYRLLHRGETEFWVEDESRCIGAISLPPVLKEAMSRAPVVFLDVPMETRLENIYDEYVRAPLARGVSPAKLQEDLERSTQAIRKRLGGGMTAEVMQGIREAFAHSDASDARERHGLWIEKLLVNYYDKTYQYAFDQQPRPILFRGDENACRQWILDRSASRKR